MKNGYLLKMLELLTGAYNRQDIQNIKHGRKLETNIGRLFSLLAWGFEIIQENADMVRLWDDLENAEGAVLDRYGANFGVARGAASDALYRILIRVKMIAQLSGGDGDTVIRAAGELLGVEFSEILLEDIYPAKVALYVDQSLLPKERLELIEQIAYAIKRILAAGVGLRLYLRTYRTYRSDLSIYRSAATGSAYTVLPVSQDRRSVVNLTINYGGFENPVLSIMPTAEDKAFRKAVRVAHGAGLCPGLQGTPPDAKKVVTGLHAGAGGAFYHSHIKSKRID